MSAIDRRSISTTSTRMGLPSTQNLFYAHSFFKTPIEVAVSVETFVQTEELNHPFRSHAYSPTPVTSPEPKASSLPPCTGMSLPRANYDPRRVCLNPFPEFSLGRHRRTIGIYAAGALVGSVLLSLLLTPFLTRLAHSSPWRIGPSWMPLFFLRTLVLRGAEMSLHRSTSPLSIGFRVYVPSWVTSSST